MTDQYVPDAETDTLTELRARLSTSLGRVSLRHELYRLMEEAEREYHQSHNCSHRGSMLAKADALLEWIENILDASPPTPPRRSGAQ